MFLHVYRESISTIFSVQTEKGFVMSSPQIFGIYKGQAITEATYNHLSDAEKSQVLTGEALQEALRGKNEMKITINGTEYDLSTENGKTNFTVYLAQHGYDANEIIALLDNPLGIDIDRIKEKLDIHDADPANRQGRADNVLLLDIDRYAKVEPFTPQPKVPENQFLEELKQMFPQAKYPKLYKKDGSLNEGKAWKELEKELLFEGFYGKSRQDRIAELVAQGQSQESAETVVDAQNAQILRVEENIERKRAQDPSYQPTEEEQRILNARTGAHDLIKHMKKFKKNVDNSTKRINNAIQKMNNWHWTDLKKDQQDKIRNAVLAYSKDQALAVNPNASETEQLAMYNAIFDEHGNVPDEKKNAFYQFMMDYVVGTDGQVNKSAKKGNFFQKLFQKRNMEGTEKRASRELGLDKKDIENMGFDWEGQINWGKALLDGLPAGALGAVFGAALSHSDSDSNSATAHAEARVDAQDITGETPYSGSVDYMVNGEVVMQIPYNGVVQCLHHIPGAFASDSQTATAFSEAKISAVLPSALITTGAAVLNSAIYQGINGNEADVFRGNLSQILQTKGQDSLTQKPGDPQAEHSSNYIPENVAILAGIKPGTDEFTLACKIVEYYVDEDGQFHKTEFLTDWQYNGGYDSKYLNKEEAAVWLNDLKKRGPIKLNKPDNQVTGNINIVAPQAYRINAFTGKDRGGLGRSGATGTHSPNTTYDFAEGLSGEVLTEMKDPNTPVTQQPDIIRGFDHSNQYQDMHEYRYEKLTQAEIDEAKRQGQLPRNLASDAVIYKLVSVVDHAHDGISIKANNVELFQLEATDQNVNGNETSNAFKLIQPRGFAGYNQSAILSIGTINELITRLNGGQPRLSN